MLDSPELGVDVVGVDDGSPERIAHLEFAALDELPEDRFSQDEHPGVDYDIVLLHLMGLLFSDHIQSFSQVLFYESAPLNLLHYFLLGDDLIILFV